MTLNIWDNAGQEDYAELRQLSYAETNIFLLFFDVTNRASFANVTSKWYPEIQTVRSQVTMTRDAPVASYLGDAAGLTPIAASLCGYRSLTHRNS
jgi:GTPase SAR1 family protein